VKPAAGGAAGIGVLNARLNYARIDRFFLTARQARNVAAAAGIQNGAARRHVIHVPLIHRNPTK
jgi:hypothetical protein